MEGEHVHRSTADERDMIRMNKPQELNRIFSTLTLIGYAVLVGLTWPFALVTGTLSLTNGGPAGAIWVFLAVCFGMLTVVLSMAEMASIEPSAGGQYHFVSVFAPKTWQKPLSYIVGWMCALGWQSTVPGSAHVCSLAIQGFAVVASDSYEPKNWHVALLTVIICSSAIIFNVFLAKKLPEIEFVVMILYFLAFLVFIIVLATMGTRSSTRELLTHFEDNAGWGSIGTACFVGVSGPVITLIGSDSAIHLAEELRDASRQLPKVMLVTAGFNYVLGFIMLLAFLFVVGDVPTILDSRTGQPYIQVIWNVTKSRPGTMALVASMILFFIFTSINANTTSSRQLYAFARDRGLPFSRWICHVSTYRHVPINATILTWLIACGLALIPLGSTAAFVNIQTIGNSGLLSSYILCIGCRLYHRNYTGTYGSLSKPPPFYLGNRRGNIINVLSILFLTVFLVSGAFPVAPRPTFSSMNWSSLALGATIAVALIAYIPLKKKYLGAGVVPSIELGAVHLDESPIAPSIDEALLLEDEEDFPLLTE